MQEDEQIIAQPLDGDIGGSRSRTPRRSVAVIVLGAMQLMLAPTLLIDALVTGRGNTPTNSWISTTLMSPRSKRSISVAFATIAMAACLFARLGGRCLPGNNGTARRGTREGLGAATSA